MLTAVNFWNIGFSVLIGQFVSDNPQALMIAVAINNFLTVLVDVIAMGLLYKAIFMDRLPQRLDNKSLSLDAVRPFDNNAGSPSDDSNPYSSPRS